MLNLYEEQSYWYLRLNGFFLLNNFVIHRDSTINYHSDADLLAIRFPFVYEEIGGQTEDWDKKLIPDPDDKKIKGIICQVKGGKIETDKLLFQEDYLEYCISRLGLTENIDEVMKQLKASSTANFKNELGNDCQITKLLISRDEYKEKEPVVQFRLGDIDTFINNRMKKYSNPKYSGRYFFDSNYIQYVIELQKR